MITIMKQLIGVISFILLQQSLHAEYRAFVIDIANTKSKIHRQILTTLDPDQYRTVYPLAQDESISYVKTWRCPGRTDFFHPICEAPDRSPATPPSQSPESQK